MRRSAAAAVSRSWREWWRGGRAAAGGEAAGAGERAGGGRRPQPPQPPQGPQPAVLLPTSQPPSRPPRRRSSTARREGALRSSRIARARGRALGAARSEAHVSELLSQWRVEHGYALLGLLKGVAGGLATVPALRRLLLWGLNQRLVESHHFDVFFETLDREAAYDQSTLHELLRTVLYMQSQGIALSETAYGVLVRVYAFQGRLREAEETLVRMRAEGFAARETVLLNAMLEGYLRTGEHQRLREFLVDESVRGKVSLNVASINALVGSLVAVGDTAAAAVVVDALRRRECPMGAALKGTNGSNDSSGGDEAATRATYGIDGVPRPDSLTFELLIDGHARALEPAGAVRALNALLAEGLELTKGVADGIVRAHALAGEDDVVRLFIGNLVRTSLAPPLWPDEDTYGPVLREKARVQDLLGLLRWLDRMSTHVRPNVDTARIVLSAHLVAEQHRQGLHVYQYLLDVGTGDEIEADAMVAGVLHKLKLGLQSQQQSQQSQQPGTGEQSYLSAVPPWRCALCDVTCTSRETLEGHAKGKKHCNKLAMCGR